MIPEAPPYHCPPGFLNNIDLLKFSKHARRKRPQARRRVFELFKSLRPQVHWLWTDHILIRIFSEPLTGVGGFFYHPLTGVSGCGGFVARANLATHVAGLTARCGHVRRRGRPCRSQRSAGGSRTLCGLWPRQRRRRRPAAGCRGTARL